MSPGRHITDLAPDEPLAGSPTRVALGWLLTLWIATGRALAHAGHPEGHSGGESILLPTAILLGSVVVIGTSTYLDRTDGIDGRVARVGVLLGVVGVFVGVLVLV